MYLATPMPVDLTYEGLSIRDWEPSRSGMHCIRVAGLPVGCGRQQTAKAARRVAKQGCGLAHNGQSGCVYSRTLLYGGNPSDQAFTASATPASSSAAAASRSFGWALAHFTLNQQEV